jgi:hypothetical protein
MTRCPLIHHNSSYGNKPFPEKKEQDALDKPSYANSNLFQERRLSYLDDWNIEELEGRREEMVEWALTRWHVDQATPAPPEPREVDETRYMPTATLAGAATIGSSSCTRQSNRPSTAYSIRPGSTCT